MAYFSLKPCLKKAMLASGLLLTSAQGHAGPVSEGPFLGLSGHWSGAGTVTMTNGATERIRCKAAYAVNATGKAVQQSLRCASDSYKVEITSNVVSEGGSLSGSWAEATRGYFWTRQWCGDLGQCGWRRLRGPSRRADPR
jgi:hypothetical protein